MGNCLVTKLKGVVNDNDLDILGKIKFKANGGLVGFNSSTVPEVFGGATEHLHSANNSTVGGFGAHTPVDLYVADTSGYIMVPKYGNITAFYVQSGLTIPSNICEMFKYCNMEMFALANFSGDVNVEGVIYGKDIAEYMPNLKYLQFRARNQGHVINIDDLVRLQSLVNVDITDAVVNGKWSDLGKIPNISYIIRCTSSVSTLSSIEEFVSNQRELGKTEKSITVDQIGGWGKVTFNGNIIPAEGSTTLSWTTSPNTITYKGQTINA